MQSTSLVKYHTPILVSVSQGKGGKKAGKKPSIERETTQTEDILNSILPPRFAFTSVVCYPLFILPLLLFSLCFCIW
jgi:hypothetical protein